MKSKKRIGSALLRYKHELHKYSETLRDSKLGNYRFRIGDYRVIFDIEGSDIVILRVGHRRDSDLNSFMKIQTYPRLSCAVKDPICSRSSLPRTRITLQP